MLMDDIAALIRGNPGIRLISFEGYCDSDGDEEYNRRLSVGCANVVRGDLVEKEVPGDMLQVRGFGESRSFAEIATAAGKLRNRRAAFLTREQQ